MQVLGDRSRKLYAKTLIEGELSKWGALKRPAPARAVTLSRLLQHQRLAGPAAEQLDALTPGVKGNIGVGDRLGSRFPPNQTSCTGIGPQTTKKLDSNSRKANPRKEETYTTPSATEVKAETSGIKRR